MIILDPKLPQPFGEVEMVDQWKLINFRIAPSNDNKLNEKGK